MAIRVGPGYLLPHGLESAIAIIGIGFARGSMNLETLNAHDTQYPVGLDRYLGAEAPKGITALGNLSILQGRTIALFCSIKCPGGAMR